MLIGLYRMVQPLTFVRQNHFYSQLSSNFMTAKEAKAIANGNSTESNQIETVLGFIKQVAERGHLTLKYFDPMSPITFKILSDLGYELELDIDEEGKRFIYISWKYA